jgi:hypothetical protein
MTAPSPYFSHTLELHSSKDTVGRVQQDLLERITALCGERRWELRRSGPKLVRRDRTEHLAGDTNLLALVSTHIPDALGVGGMLHVEFYFQTPAPDSDAAGYLIAVCRSYPVAINRQMGARFNKNDPMYPEDLYNLVEPLFDQLVQAY